MPCKESIFSFFYLHCCASTNPGVQNKTTQKSFTEWLVSVEQKGRKTKDVKLLFLNMIFASSKEMLWMQPKQLWKNTPATSGRLPAGKPMFQTFQRLTAVKGLLIWRTSMGKKRNFIHWVHYLPWVIFSGLFLTQKSILLYINFH